MVNSFVEELNKQTLSRYSLGYIWPSFIFWSLNILLSSYFFSMDLNWWRNLGTETQSLLAGGFVVIVLVTAYLLFICTPSVYIILQGRPFRQMRFLSFFQIRRLNSLQRKEIKLAKRIKKLKIYRDLLLNPDIKESEILDLDNFLERLNPLYHRILIRVFFLGIRTIFTLTDTKLIQDLIDLVYLIENNRNHLYKNSSFQKLEKRFLILYRRLLHTFDYQIYKTELDRSKYINILTSSYPPYEAWISPTTFGNCWGAIEAYPVTRYGISISLLWPRLRAVLPEVYTSYLDQAKTRIDTCLSIWLLSGVLWLFWTLYILFYRGFSDLKMLLVIFVICFLLLIISYFTSLRQTITYGTLIEAAIDLFRRDVLQKMSLEMPLDIDGEKRLWAELTSFWIANVVSDKIKFSLTTKD